MKKTDKKRENALRHVLTEVCEQALDIVDGFAWVTHTVVYTRFPQSLRVICVFETDEALTQAYNTDAVAALRKLVVQALAEVDIKIQAPDKHIIFDTEQTCDREHGGNWSARLSKI